MSILPIALSVAGGVLSAVSQAKQGQMAADTESSNAQISSMQATQAQVSGDYEVSKLAREKQRTLSTQQARYAKSGVLINEGSPLEVQAETAANYEMDISALKYNTSVEVNKNNYAAEVSNQMAKRYKQAGYVNAGATLLSTAGNIGLMSGVYGSKPTTTTTKTTAVK